MKQKLILLVLALFTTIGAWATVSFVEGRPYTIKHSSSGLYVNMEASGANAKLSATFSVVYFTASGDNWTISNLTNSLFASGWHALASSSNSTPWIIADVDGKDDTYTLNQQSSANKGYLGSDETNADSPMFCDKDATEFEIKALDYAPTLPFDKYIRIGDMVNSFTAATSASDNAHWYLITNRRKKDAGQQVDESYNTPVYFTGAGSKLKREDININPGAINNNPVATYRNDLVRFVSDGNGGYNLQFANGAFVDASLQGTYSQSEAGSYLFYNTTDGGYGFGWNLNDDTVDKNRVDNNGQGQPLSFYQKGTITATSGNNVWSLYPVTFETPVTVTYKVLYGESNSEVGEGTAKSIVGATVPSLPSSAKRDFCTYGLLRANSDLTGDVTTVPAGGTTVYVKATWDGPFPVFADYASINEWNFLKLKNQRYVTYEAASDPNVTLNQTSGTVDTRWAFVGNPYDGFNLYNKTTKDEKVLASNGGEASDGGTGENTQTRLVAIDDATYTHNLWFSKKSTAIDGVNGFYLYDDVGYALNYRADANLAYWTGGTGNGSTFSVEPDDINFAASVAAYSSYFEDENKDKYFGISTSDASALQDDYATYSAACTEDQYLAFRDDINSRIRIPASGYYRLKNKDVSLYLGATTGLVGVESGTGAETIVKLTNNGNGTFYLATQGEYIKISNVQAGGQLRMGSGAEALQYDIPEAGSVVFSFADGNWEKKSVTLDEGVVKNGLASADASKWELEDASTFSVTLNPANDNTATAHTYATLCVPFNITALEGISSKEVKAYAPTKSGNYLLPGDGATTVTEGTPVLLIGEDDATTRVTATIGSNYATAPATTNALTGTFTGATIDTRETGTNFVLGMDANNSNLVGFYHVDNENFPLGANRAYLKLDGSGDPTHVKGFVLMFDEDDETSINTVNGSELMVNDPIYNLAGQRLNKMQKGINIVNGKKVLK